MKRKTEWEKFDAYIRNTRRGYTCDREPDGGYSDSWLDGAWIGWRAAKRQAKREQRSKKP